MWARERENYLGSFISILKFSVLLNYLTSMYSFEKNFKVKLKKLKFVLKYNM